MNLQAGNQRKTWMSSFLHGAYSLFKVKISIDCPLISFVGGRTRSAGSLSNCFQPPFVLHGIIYWNSLEESTKDY